MDIRQGPRRFDQLAKRGVVSRLAVLEREIAVDDDGAGFHRPCSQFADAGGEIIGHIHTTGVFLGRIRGDMRVGKERKRMPVARFAEQPGITNGRRKRGGGSGNGGAFDKITTGKLRQFNWHNSK